jgi:hypothetical protein
MYFNIHSGSCASAERDLPSLATVFFTASQWSQRRRHRTRRGRVAPLGHRFSRYPAAFLDRSHQRLLVARMACTSSHSLLSTMGSCSPGVNIAPYSPKRSKETSMMVGLAVRPYGVK